MKSKKTLTLVALSALMVGTKLLVSEPKIIINNNERNTSYTENYTAESFNRISVIRSDRQLKRRNVRETYPPQHVEIVKPIEIIKPIEKTPVNKAPKATDIILNTDSSVNDPGYKYEWAVTATEANKAWSLIDQKREIKVAVLDTGIDYTHVDLKNRALSDLGYNFVEDKKDVTDNNGHGTHVSGIIAAQANNNQGITGIAGGLDVKIIPVKVLDKNGEGKSDNIAKGIKYAADNGADIINLSFGTIGESEDISSAIKYAKEKGVFIVAAAGNDNSNADLYSPAGEDEDVYTVSAITSQYKKAGFSNYGASIDAAAPGVNIISTVPGGYAVWDGTSMAAPVVSGIAALIKAENPDLTPDEIAKILDSTATDILSKGEDLQSGYGVVNAYKAISTVKSTS